MKTFVIKGILLCTLCILAFVAIGKALPFYWGNRMLLSKMEVLQNQKDVNTLFIGGSTVFRQIDPKIFDSKVEDKSIKSFNLGTDGCYPTQCYYIAENILRDKAYNIKNIFISLNAFDPIPKGRYQTTRIKFYSTFKILIHRLKYLANLKQLSKEDQNKYLKKYLGTFYEGFFKLGMRRDIIQLIKGQTTFGSSYFGLEQNGYVALNGNHRNNNKELKQTENVTTKIGQNWTKAREENQINDFNAAHLAIINKLISAAKKKNCEIIFILPPQSFVLETIPEIYGLYNQIPSANKLDVNDPSKYPKLYDLDHKWDGGHLNDRGAKYYTNALVSEYNQNIY